MEKLDAEVSKEDADGGSGISRERRVGNVLMTLRRLLEQNEACLKVANRIRTPLAKSILGKPLCIQVRIRGRSFSYLFFVFLESLFTTTLKSRSTQLEVEVILTK